MIKVSETRSALRRMALTKVASLIGGQPGWLQQKQNKTKLELQMNVNGGK